MQHLKNLFFFSKMQFCNYFLVFLTEGNSNTNRDEEGQREVEVTNETCSPQLKVQDRIENEGIMRLVLPKKSYLGVQNSN